MNVDDLEDDVPSIPPPLPSIPPLSLLGPSSLLSGSSVIPSNPIRAAVNNVSLDLPIALSAPQIAPPPTHSTPVQQPPHALNLVQTPRAETLMVRVDQPVEGVEFQPHTLLRGVDGGVVMPANRRLEYSWLRSKTRRTCEGTGCTRQREPATLQDLVTGRRYCSKQCMLLGFRAGGRLVHSTDASRRRIPKSESAIDYDETDHAVWDVRPFVEDSGWVEVGKERNYVPTPADVGHVLKLVVGALSQDGSATTVSTTSDETPVVIGPPPPPPKRRLIHAHHVLMNPQFADATALQFRVVTYNILADIYATQQVFPYCPKWALSWRYRRVQLLRELEVYDADIICLQEVQQDHFQQFLLPALSRQGYDGVYKAKTREAMGTQGKIDGCATLFRRNKFTLIDTHDIEFNKAAYQMAAQGAFAQLSQAREAAANANPRNQNIGAADAPNDAGSQRCLKRLCKDNVAHVLILEGVGMNGEVEHICVANTHIFWDPEYPDVKLWQTHVLLQELEGVTGPRQLPLILCGDFNSTPDSSVVELLAQEQVDPKHPDLGFDNVGILPPASQLTHTLGLVSAVALVTGSEPPVTNYTSTYKGVLDYVWVNESLAAVACLEMPTEEELRGIDDSPLPNSSFPSDHVAICVDIRMASQNIGSHVQAQGGGVY